MKKIFLILILVIVAMSLIAFFQSNIIEDIPIPEDIDTELIKPPTDIDIEPVEPPVGILPFDSGVMGKVLLGPVCPVVREGDDSCNDKPYVTTINVFSSGDDKNPFSSVESGKDGNYKVMLPPGNYILRPTSGKMFPRCGEQAITIEPSLLSEVNLFCDTGVR